VVSGIAPDGALLVRGDDGTVRGVRGGSLVFADDSTPSEELT
jgi:hypothetical protein